MAQIIQHCCGACAAIPSNLCADQIPQRLEVQVSGVQSVTRQQPRGLLEGGIVGQRRLIGVVDAEQRVRIGADDKAAIHNAVGEVRPASVSMARARALALNSTGKVTKAKTSAPAKNNTPSQAI